jgi:predicted amidohydrolase YtcJ
VLLPRLKATGAIASIQPSHACADAPFATSRLGPERIQTAYRAASLLRAGIPIVLGSDAPIAPIDPRVTYLAAVQRAAGASPCVNAAEALTPLATLRALSGSPASAPNGTVGPRLKAGDPADLVVWNVDPLAAPLDFVRARPLLAVVGGRVVYREAGGDL